ncbi:unnamed protein product [Peniophora sp. CBMAI 1063]|nr:unnamed protein product [Peniophora sp. CBMAI 1063]
MAATHYLPPVLLGTVVALYYPSGEVLWTIGKVLLLLVLLQSISEEKAAEQDKIASAESITTEPVLSLLDEKRHGAVQHHIHAQHNFASFISAISAVPTLNPLSPEKPFGALYFITNSLDENFVVAAQIGEDGIASDVKAISANGVGAQGQPAKPGALFSQGPVQVNQATNRLAFVNAGSNTVQLFDINPKMPTNITAIGKPVPSGGDFPQSIAWNNAGDKMCVLNGGLKSNVQCFLVDSKDQGGIIAVAKGLPTDLENSPGYIRVWLLADNGTIAETPFQVNSTDTAGSLIFSLSQKAGSLVYVGADATNGGVVIDLTAGPGGAVFKPIDLPNNKGNCWSVHAPKTGSFFISDLLSDKINEVTLDKNNNATLVRQYDVPGLGPNEAVVAEIQGQEFMYMLMEGAESIGVWRLDGPGKAVLTQLWDVAVPVEFTGVTVDELLISGIHFCNQDHWDADVRRTQVGVSGFKQSPPRGQVMAKWWSSDGQLQGSEASSVRELLEPSLRVWRA